jgi:O-antigen/teichoic acid export membrane protein
MLPSDLSALSERLRSARWGEALHRLLRLARSQLYTTAYYLIGGAAISALASLIFWMIATRLTSPAAIGSATAAVSAAALLAVVFDLGLSTTAAYLGAAQDSTADRINAVVAIGWAVTGLAALVFVSGLPIWSPGLALFAHDPLLAGVLIAFSILNHQLMIQDGVMLARGKPAFVLWRTLLCNVPMIGLLFPALALTGELRAPFLAYTLPNIVVGLAAGLLVLPRAMPGYRLVGRLNLGLARELARFSLPSYGANTLWTGSALMLPLIAINRLSAAETGTFFVSWSLLSMILIIPRSVCAAVFIQGVIDEGQIVRSALRALALIAIGVIPLAMALWYGGGLALGLFGRPYLRLDILRPLLLSVAPFSINGVFFMYLRVRRRPTATLLFAGLAALSTIALSADLAGRFGLAGLAWGWALGHGLAALVALACLAPQLIKRAKGGRP